MRRHRNRQFRSLQQSRHPQYETYSAGQFQAHDSMRRTMSCALCGRLKRTFPAGAPVGAPDLIKASIGIEYSLAGVPKEEQEEYTAWWDMHAFGAWLANMAGKHGKAGNYTVFEDPAVASGLKWQYSSTKPDGRELNNAKLAHALVHVLVPTQFHEEKWAAFGITDLHMDDFIKKVDNKGANTYYKPVEGKGGILANIAKCACPVFCTHDTTYPRSDRDLHRQRTWLAQVQSVER